MVSEVYQTRRHRDTGIEKTRINGLWVYRVVSKVHSCKEELTVLAHRLEFKEGFMFVIAFVLLMLLSACSAPAPSGRDAARALIDESAAAMGGWAAMDAVKVQQIITAGGDFEPMQAVKPNGEPRVINRFSQGIIYDFENKRMRLTMDSIREYPNT